MNMHHLLTLKLMVCIKLLTGISLTFMETNLLIIASHAFTLLFYITGLHGKDALYSYMLTVMTDMDFSTAGQDNVHRSTTGYIFRKFMSNDPEYNFTNVLSGQYWIEMRLAEIYRSVQKHMPAKMNLKKAYADLKTIRDRVGLTPIRNKK